MRVAAALSVGLLCSVWMAGSACAAERWPEAACKDIQELEAFYLKTTPDLTTRAWSVRPLLVLLRDHCGLEVTMKIEESDRVIKRRLWPSYVCEALASTKGVRKVLAKPLDKHCSENVEAKDKS